jgi:hypothetical protein
MDQITNPHYPDAFSVYFKCPTGHGVHATDRHSSGWMWDDGITQNLEPARQSAARDRTEWATETPEHGGLLWLLNPAAKR